ncbi:hypothetical protein CWI38_1234p0020 [Hamiltosporidium tvaerminnensis]|uniref:Uncharacterized protein n=1 Tax=Hamiltosporidium tvaerminnensis TaxID=1176355 RepID=A0A4Q9LS53_9MICR|nr:hypothetical protein CWI38_1234p0020 [Hamiltosporidium tvaerminnensis]
MIVYIESDDRYFEAEVYGGEVSKYKVNIGNMEGSVSKGKINRSKDKDGRGSNKGKGKDNTFLNFNIINNTPLNIYANNKPPLVNTTDIYTFLVNSTDDNTPLITLPIITPFFPTTHIINSPFPSIPYSIDNLEINSNICYNRNNRRDMCDSKNYSIEDTGNNTIDTNKSSTNTTINTNTTTFTNNTNNNNTITKILLKSDDKSEISRYYEDDCSIEDFVNELGVLSKEIMRWLLKSFYVEIQSLKNIVMSVVDQILLIRILDMLSDWENIGFRFIRDCLRISYLEKVGYIKLLNNFPLFFFIVHIYRIYSYYYIMYLKGLQIPMNVEAYIHRIYSYYHIMYHKGLQIPMNVEAYIHRIYSYYHVMYLKGLQIPMNVEAYIQNLWLLSYDVS